jgi:hypothetical protein
MITTDTTVTNSCPDTTDEQTCTDANAACNFTPAGESVATRPVVCVNSSGTIVSNSFCPTPMPPTHSNDPDLPPTDRPCP